MAEIPQITEADLARAVICFAKCEECATGYHFDIPTWHTWAGPEDIEHAAKTGQADPRSSRCGCACAGSETIAIP